MLGAGWVGENDWMHKANRTDEIKFNLTQSHELGGDIRYVFRLRLYVRLPTHTATTLELLYNHESEHRAIFIAHRYGTAFCAINIAAAKCALQ